MIKPGFGLNYKARQSNWDTDIAYFNAISLNVIRPHMPTFPDIWSAGTITQGSYAFWRKCAQYFHNRGFWVTWGPSTLISAGGFGGHGLNSTNWQLHHDFVVAEATYLQQQGIVIDEFCVGNELEAFIDGTTFTLTQLNDNIRQLASDVKAVYSLGKITYSVTDNWVNGTSPIAEWVANGLGGLDTISIHVYGFIQNGVVTVNTYTKIAPMMNAFGNNCYISEFNIDPGDIRIKSLAPSIQTNAMNTLWNTYIKPKNVPKCILFSWVGYLNNDNQFSQLLTNGSMNEMWFSFFRSRPTYYTPRSASIDRYIADRQTTITRDPCIDRYIIK
jgi:hypothetical protein